MEYEARRKKRERLIDSLAFRIWRWELRRGIRVPYGPTFKRAAMLCLFATKEESSNSLIWHNRAFRFYTKGKFVEYEPGKSDEEIMKEILNPDLGETTSEK